MQKANRHRTRIVLPVVVFHTTKAPDYQQKVKSKAPTNLKTLHWIFTKTRKIWNEWPGKRAFNRSHTILRCWLQSLNWATETRAVFTAPYLYLSMQLFYCAHLLLTQSAFRIFFRLSLIPGKKEKEVTIQVRHSAMSETKVKQIRRMQSPQIIIIFIHENYAQK